MRHNEIDHIILTVLVEHCVKVLNMYPLSSLKNMICYKISRSYQENNEITIPIISERIETPYIYHLFHFCIFHVPIFLHFRSYTPYFYHISMSIISISMNHCLFLTGRYSKIYSEMHNELVVTKDNAEKPI